MTDGAAMNLPTPFEPVAPAGAVLRDARNLALQHGSLRGTDTDLDLAAVASPGRRHAISEDAHSAFDGPLPLYVVADGVGGGAMAARASRELVDCVHARLREAPIDEQALRQALLDADVEVRRSLAQITEAMGAATVALCVATTPDFSDWLVAWVGDCRVYRVGATGATVLLTRDDSYRHLGETPPAGGSPDDPARMLGNGAVIAPNVRRVALDLGAALVLCSDGVHARLDERDFGAAMQRAELPLVQRCARLVELARERGSSDDATIIAVNRWRTHSPPRSLA
jgi:protein phosphatase